MPTNDADRASRRAQMRAAMNRNSNNSDIFAKKEPNSDDDSKDSNTENKNPDNVRKSGGNSAFDSPENAFAKKIGYKSTIRRQREKKIDEILNRSMRNVNGNNILGNKNSSLSDSEESDNSKDLNLKSPFAKRQKTVEDNLLQTSLSTTNNLQLPQHSASSSSSSTTGVWAGGVDFEAEYEKNKLSRAEQEKAQIELNTKIANAPRIRTNATWNNIIKKITTFETKDEKMLKINRAKQEIEDAKWDNLKAEEEWLKENQEDDEENGNSGLGEKFGGVRYTLDNFAKEGEDYVFDILGNNRNKNQVLLNLNGASSSSSSSSSANKNNNNIVDDEEIVDVFLSDDSDSDADVPEITKEAQLEILQESLNNATKEDERSALMNEIVNLQDEIKEEENENKNSNDDDLIRKKNDRPNLAPDDPSANSNSNVKTENDNSSIVPTDKPQNDKNYIERNGNLLKVRDDLAQKLFPHQIDAMKWLVDLWRSGTGGILADEMGLGKTVSACAYLHAMRRSKIGSIRHVLIICPKAMITEWERHCQKWCGVDKTSWGGRSHGADGYNVVAVQETENSGKSAKALDEKMRSVVNHERGGVLIMNYERVTARFKELKMCKFNESGAFDFMNDGQDNQRDLEAKNIMDKTRKRESAANDALDGLNSNSDDDKKKKNTGSRRGGKKRSLEDLRDYDTEKPWDIIIVDEGHKVKNMATETTKAIKDLKAQQKILLTGTPIQNRLSELWTLMSVCTNLCRNSRQGKREMVIGNRTAFKVMFEDVINKGSMKCSTDYDVKMKSLRCKRLKALIKPVLKRRTKAMIKSVVLPWKNEIIAWCPMVLKYCDFRNYRQQVQLIKYTLKIQFKMVNSQKYDKIN